MSVFDHPWMGGLFADPEMAGLWSAEAQLRHFRAFEAAWTMALAEAGRVEAKRGRDLAKAIESFAFDMADLRAGTGDDGVPIPALVRQLKAALGAAGVHQGATSQDVMDTSLALSMVATLDLLDTRLAGLKAALSALEDRFGAAPLMGRTRMQAALPITVADRVQSWRAPLDDLCAVAAETRPRLARVQIGGPVGNRGTLGPDATRIVASVSAALGLAPAARSWHSGRQSVADFAHVLALVTGILGKMGQDLALMAQMGEVTLAHGGGSSAMPHKENPIRAELLVTLARFNAAQISAVHTGMVHEQERSGAAWALEWMVLPHMAQAAGRALVAAQSLAGEITQMGTPEGKV